MAGFFEWDAAQYGLGVAEMDREHQTLIGHMNTLHALAERQAPAAELAAALDVLGRYTAKHFKDEEAYMERIGHTHLSKHRLMHQALLQKFGTHAEEFRRSGVLSRQFFLFLTTWLKAHLRGIDAQYAGKTRAA